ncbi:MAG: protein kinase domain-containing protein [Gemmatimonadaceae bacterium]
MNSDLDLPPAVIAALTPRFTIEREIGAGGMATVFLARDERNDRPVALKVLRDGAETAGDVERFEREIKLLARLQHPLILPLHDSGVAADALYFVMPYVEGEALRDRLSRDGPLPIADALTIATEVADALAYAHAQGVVHRDIKPENIMLWRGHAVVCDFGIASIAHSAARDDAERLTRAGHWLGTPGYMSPEQAAGEPEVGPASDQYSLALVLYEMLTGSPPFIGPLRSVLSRQLTESPMPVAALRPDVPPGLSAVIERALARGPDARWPSTARFGEALRASSGQPTTPAPAPESADARVSLAILPFTNVGGDSANEFFSDGMTEELIGSLSRLPRLRVVSRTSAFAFRGKDVALAEIGSRLRVGFVLTGSVRRAGERLRLSAHLSRVADDTLLWSETYERKVADVFDVQDDLSKRITATVRDALGAPVAPTPARMHPAGSVTAYDQYLLGRYCWNKRTTASLREGMTFFQRAIDADPTYAPAYAGLADSHALLASSGATPPTAAYPAARDAAIRAIELDASLAEGHASLGLVKLNYDWDWDGAERELRTAIELNPSYSTARQWYSSYLSSMGRFDEAIASAQQAAALDPMSVTATIRVGIAYTYALRYEEAAAQLERAMAMEPGFLHAHSWLANAYIGLGRHDDAVRIAEEAYALSQNSPAFRGLVASIYRSVGRIDEARTIIREMVRAPDAPPFFMALLHLIIDEHEQVYEWLDRGVRERGDLMHSLRTNPFFMTAWDDPRFATVLEQLRLGPPLKGRTSPQR